MCPPSRDPRAHLHRVPISLHCGLSNGHAPHHGRTQAGFPADDDVGEGSLLLIIACPPPVPISLRRQGCQRIFVTWCVAPPPRALPRTLPRRDRPVAALLPAASESNPEASVPSLHDRLRKVPPRPRRLVLSASCTPPNPMRGADACAAPGPVSKGAVEPCRVQALQPTFPQRRVQGCVLLPLALARRHRRSVLPHGLLQRHGEELCCATRPGVVPGLLLETQR